MNDWNSIIKLFDYKEEQEFSDEELNGNAIHPKLLVEYEVNSK